MCSETGSYISNNTAASIANGSSNNLENSTNELDVHYNGKIRYQYYATICVNMSTIASGIALGWASPTIPLLLSDETPLQSGTITVYEASWVTSLFCISAIKSCWLFGLLADRYGRRIALISSGIPQFISWFLISFGDNLYYLYASRYLTGITSGAIFTIIPLYVTEISDDRIRGRLGSLLSILGNFGILLGYIIGAYINYFMVPFIGCIFSTVFLVSLLFLPETPRYLLLKNKIEQAENSLIYYRGYRKDYRGTDDFYHDMFKLKQSLCTNLSNQNDGHIHNNNNNNNHNNYNNNNADNERNNKITFKDFTVRSTRRGILIASIVIIMTQFCGTFAILNYTASIFAEATGSNLSPNNSTIIVGVLQLIGSYLSGILVDRVGRKILLLLSSFGTGIGLMITGIYFYLKYINMNMEAFSWIPLVSLSTVVLVAALGIIPLAYVITPEILPQKLRSSVSGFFMIFLWVIRFLSIKYFTDVINLIELHGCMWAFAGCCFFETLFVIFWLPETKGKSFDDIIKLLGGL